VYKECVLRGIVDRMRENATAILQRQILTAYERGRNGQPLFPQSIVQDRNASFDNSVLKIFQSGALNAVNPAFASTVQRAVGQGYQTSRRSPTSVFSCPHNVTNALRGRPDGSVLETLGILMNPACSPYHAYVLSNTYVLDNASNEWNDTLTRLAWDNGHYPRMGVDANGNPIVLTPGSIVGSNVIQALQTGFRQLENANDIDQMVGALFAGITTHVVSDARGLTGLTRPIGSFASYLDQVVSESAAGLRSSVINAGLQILAAQQQIENAIRALALGILQKAAQISASLRDKERACWDLVIDAVCDSSLSSSNTCTDSGGTTYRVATSTYQFAQGVINSQIAPHVTLHRQIASSTEFALGEIAKLVAQLTNTDSYTGQLAALQGLDRLVSQGVTLHKPQDRANEQAAFDTLVGQNGGSGSLDALLDDTVKAWADSTADPALGWCNINNAAVITMWKTRWKQ